MCDELRDVFSMAIYEQPTPFPSKNPEHHKQQLHELQHRRASGSIEDVRGYTNGDEDLLVREGHEDDGAGGDYADLEHNYSSAFPSEDVDLGFVI